MSTYATTANIEGNTVVDRKLLQKQSTLATDALSNILDESWARQAFSVSSGQMEAIDAKNRVFSTAQLKFTDTSLGGNYAINPRPQYTRYSDPPVRGLRSSFEEPSIGSFGIELGMGRYYSEAIDDNAQTIHMRFGVPNYNSLTQFFTGFYNTSAGRLARTGRTYGFFSSILNNVGYAVGLVAQIVVWPIMAVHALGYVSNFFFGKETSKYYYLKPTMLVYWGAVNSMVNKIAVGRGLMPSILSQESPQKIGTAYKLDTTTLQQIHDYFPESLFSNDGGYDIYKVANRAQRKKIAADRVAYEKFNTAEDKTGTGSDFSEAVKGLVGDIIGTDIKGKSWADAIQYWLKLGVDSPRGDEKNTGPEPDIRINPENVNKTNPNFDKFTSFLAAELDDGAAFATFRVDYTGSVSESFSNSVRDSDIAGKVNGAAGSARGANFSFAGGNIVGGALGKIIGGVTDAVGAVATGVLDAMNFSGLIGIKGGSFVDIPKHWDSSSASLPKSNYTIKLISPYGNVYSQMQNIYIPLAMLLAAALPLSTGKQSYASPFLVELYDKGRHQTRLGMIDSLSITRGTANLGFNNQGHPMAIDVSFSIVDMSSVLHMQMSKGFFDGSGPDVARVLGGAVAGALGGTAVAGPAGGVAGGLGGAAVGSFLSGAEGIFDEETVFSDYMNTLSSLGLHEQFHKIPKLRLRAARSIRTMQAMTSKAAWALFVKEETPIGMLEVFYRGTNR